MFSTKVGTLPHPHCSADDSSLPETPRQEFLSPENPRLRFEVSNRWSRKYGDTVHQVFIRSSLCCRFLKFLSIHLPGQVIISCLLFYILHKFTLTDVTYFSMTCCYVPFQDPVLCIISVISVSLVKPSVMLLLFVGNYKGYVFELASSGIMVTEILSVDQQATHQCL